MKLSTNSEFQDRYFVVEAQLTPFRKLRQIELELREIESAIKQSEFSSRRLMLKLSKLNTQDEEDAITADEITWQMQQQQALLADAYERRQNFYRMRDELLEKTPKEYWQQGFEAAESDQWKLYFSKQISNCLALGLPVPVQAIEGMMALPPAVRKEAVALIKSQVETLKLEYSGV